MRSYVAAVGAALLLLSGGAQAQSFLDQPDVHIGFYRGNGWFENRSQHLEGFTLGGDLPLGKYNPKKGVFSFSPRIVFAGSNRHGPDTDGNIYRLMFTWKKELGGKGVYGGLGLGASFTDSKINEFVDVGGVTGQFLLGYQFLHSGHRVKPFVELSYFAGTDEKLSGFAFDLGVRF